MKKPSLQFDIQEGLDEFLIPVYFNKEVLIRYMYDSRFYCEFVSETYGTIYSTHGDFTISFGININSSVIMWLGDIKSLPTKEQFYLLVENKEPENEIKSEFYDAQINAVFTEPTLLIQCLNEIEKFNSLFYQTYNIHLYKEKTIEERINEVTRYKRIIMNNEDDFKIFISELNEIINENTNNQEIRQLLIDKELFKPEDLKNLKGNKLLEKLYSTILNDTDNNIASFFYLYDLRLWADHSNMKDKYTNILKLLKIDEQTNNFNMVMNKLVNEILNSVINLQRNI